MTKEETVILRRVAGGGPTKDPMPLVTAPHTDAMDFTARADARYGVAMRAIAQAARIAA
jgi:hypothetical protein